MIELRGMKDFSNADVKIKDLPVEVKEQIEQTLIMLDENYGEVGSRTFEGGKVIVVQSNQEALEVHSQYNLNNNEFSDCIVSSDGLWLMVLVIYGAENNIVVFGQQEYIEQYL